MFLFSFQPRDAACGYDIASFVSKEMKLICIICNILVVMTANSKMWNKHCEVDKRKRNVFDTACWRPNVFQKERKTSPKHGLFYFNGLYMNLYFIFQFFHIY